MNEEKLINLTGTKISARGQSEYYYSFFVFQEQKIGGKRKGHRYNNLNHTFVISRMHYFSGDLDYDDHFEQRKIRIREIYLA